ncbi:hypothetical protein Gpo141_00013180 [Globisporangium polare]
MATFPLPSSPFPRLRLTPEDLQRLEGVATDVVQKTIAQYHRHRTEHEGVVDKKRWKKIKSKGDVTTYRERHVTLDDDAIDASFRPSSAASPCSSSGASPLPSQGGGDGAVCTKRITSMVTFGSMPGDLDDVMYGALNSSTEEMQLKSAYVDDGFVDWALLVSIAKPSEFEPFRDTSLKWNVKGHPLLVGAVMRIRDAVYIESMGTTVTPNGERLGYHLYHSVAVAGVRELTDMHILRLDFTVCQFFRQRDPKNVEVYGRGLFAPTGDAPASLLAITNADVALSVSKHTHCAEMKKLSRLVGSRPSLPTHQSTFSATLTTEPGSPMSSSTSHARASWPPPSSSQSTSCALCSKTVGNGLSFARSKEKHCRICCERICSRCRVHKTIYQPSPTETKKLTGVDMAFCTRCNQLAASASSQTFAVLDVRAAQGKRVDYSEATGVHCMQEALREENCR